MKFKSMIVGVLLLVISACAHAQDAPAPTQPNPAPQVREQQRDRIAAYVKELGLSDAQVDKIRTIISNYRKEYMAVSKGTGTDAEKQAKLDAAKATAAKDLKVILAEAKVEQAKQDDWVERILAPRMLGVRPMAPPASSDSPRKLRKGMINRMLDVLKLTEEQQNKIEDLQKEHDEKVKAVNSDTSVSLDDRIKKAHELRTKLIDDVKALLTDEQKKKYEEILNRPPVFEQPKQP